MRQFRDLIPPMRRNWESLSRAQESQSVFDGRDESTRIIHRRKLGSYAPHGFCNPKGKKHVTNVDNASTFHVHGNGDREPTASCLSRREKLSKVETAL